MTKDILKSPRPPVPPTPPETRTTVGPFNVPADQANKALHAEIRRLKGLYKKEVETKRSERKRANHLYGQLKRKEQGYREMKEQRNQALREAGKLREQLMQARSNTLAGNDNASYLAGQLLHLNHYCQEHSIGEVGDSVVHTTIEELARLRAQVAEYQRYIIDLQNHVLVMTPDWEVDEAISELEKALGEVFNRKETTK